MSRPPPTIELGIPSLRWSARAYVLGLAPEDAALAEARWPVCDPCSEPEVAINVSLVADPVGLEPTDFLVDGRAQWSSRTEATILASAGRAEVWREGDRLRGHGCVRASHPMRGLNTLLRALTAIGLALRSVLLLHASAVHAGAGGLVLLGSSGAGKTTTARRLGREGMKRLADDVIGLDLATWPPVLHAVPFEWRRPDPRVPQVPCLAGLRVRKGAEAAAIAPLPDPVACWRDAVIALAPPPDGQQQLLRAFSELCRIPLAAYDVPPSGSIVGPVRRWVEALGPVPADADLDSRPTVHHTGSIMISAEFLGGRAIRRAPNVAWRVLDGAAVLVTPGSPTLVTLNPVGTRVWELADGRPAGEIVDAVVNEFEVSGSQAREDVEVFVKQMAAKGFLIVEVPGESR